MSQDQLESSDLNALIIARKGRQDMLRALFGAEEEQPTSTPKLDPNKPITGGGGKPIAFTPAAFDMLFPGKPDKDTMN